MVVGVFLREAVAADGVVDFHLLHHLDGEGELGGPWLPRGPVGQVELGAGRIPDLRLQAKVVVDGREEIGFLLADHVNHLERRTRTAGVGGGVHDLARPPPERVDQGQCPQPLLRGKAGDARRLLREAVAGVVPVDPDPVAVKIQQIRGPGPVQIREPHAPPVELPRCFEDGAVGHDHHRPELAIAQVGPVPHLGRGHLDEVRQPVAGHVRELHDAEHARGEHRPAAVVVVIAWCPAGLAVAVAAEARIPHVRVARDHEQVVAAVAVEVDVLDLRAAPVDIRHLLEGAERAPVIALPQEGAGRGALEGDQRGDPAAVEVDDLRGLGAEAGLGAHGAAAREQAAGEVAMVAEAAALAREQARQALAVEVDPLRLEADGGDVHVRERVLRHGPCLRGARRQGVTEFERGQGRPGIRGVRAGVARGGHRAEPARRRVLVVGEVERLHEVGLGPQLRKAMEDEDAPAQPVRAHLEARAVGGEGVFATGPFRVRRRVRGGGLFSVLAVVEHDLEHGGHRGLRIRGEQRLRVHLGVAPADALGVTVGERREAVVAVGLAPARERHVLQILGDIGHLQDVAAVVLDPVEQPREHARGILRVGDPRLGGAAVEGLHVGAGGDDPVRLPRLRVGPALDTREGPFGARAIPGDPVIAAREGVVRPRARGGGLCARGDELLGAGQDEDVALLGVPVFREALVRGSGHRPERQAPAEPEQAIAGAAVVLEGEAGREAARLRQAEGHGVRARARRRVGLEGLAERRQRAAALGERQGRRLRGAHRERRDLRLRGLRRRALRRLERVAGPRGVAGLRRLQRGPDVAGVRESGFGVDAGARGLADRGTRGHVVALHGCLRS